MSEHIEGGPETLPVFVQALPASALTPGSGQTVRVRDTAVALFNLEGEYYAIEDRCPHRGGPLGAGWVEDGQVSCPLHGWAFDIRTGHCLTRSDKPVRAFPTRIAEGFVEVNISGQI